MPDAARGAGLTIFMTGAVSEAQQAQIRAAAPEAEVLYFAKRDDLERAVERADVVAGSIPAAGLAR